MKWIGIGVCGLLFIYCALGFFSSAIAVQYKADPRKESIRMWVCAGLCLASIGMAVELFMH